MAGKSQQVMGLVSLSFAGTPWAFNLGLNMYIWTGFPFCSWTNENSLQKLPKTRLTKMLAWNNHSTFYQFSFRARNLSMNLALASAYGVFCLTPSCSSGFAGFGGLDFPGGLASFFLFLACSDFSTLASLTLATKSL